MLPPAKVGGAGAAAAMLLLMLLLRFHWPCRLEWREVVLGMAEVLCVAAEDDDDDVGAAYCEYTLGACVWDD